MGRTRHRRHERAVGKAWPGRARRDSSVRRATQRDRCAAADCTAPDYVVIQRSFAAWPPGAAARTPPEAGHPAGAPAEGSGSRDGDVERLPLTTVPESHCRAPECSSALSGHPSIPAGRPQLPARGENGHAFALINRCFLPLRSGGRCRRRKGARNDVALLLVFHHRRKQRPPPSALPGSFPRCAGEAKASARSTCCSFSLRAARKDMRSRTYVYRFPFSPRQRRAPAAHSIRDFRQGG